MEVCTSRCGSGGIEKKGFYYKKWRKKDSGEEKVVFSDYMHDNGDLDYKEHQVNDKSMNEEYQKLGEISHLKKKPQNFLGTGHENREGDVQQELVVHDYPSPCHYLLKEEAIVHHPDLLFIEFRRRMHEKNQNICGETRMNEYQSRRCELMNTKTKDV